MSTEKKLAETSKNKTTKTKKSAGFGLILLILASTIGGGYVLWQDIQAIHKQIDKQSNVTQKNLNQAQDRLEKLERAIEQNQKQLDTLKAQYQQKNKTLQRHNVPIHGEDAKLILARVEHLLIIAEQSLAFKKDYRAALHAMEAAKQRLKGINTPGLTKIQAQLTTDLNNLYAINETDRSGLALYLSDLIERADKLPLREGVLMKQDTAHQQKNEINNPSGFLSQVWNDIKSLVIITHNQIEKPTTLLPSEAYFIYLNLRLELSSAKLSVLNRDARNFHLSIQLILDWLHDYFDMSDAGVINIIKSLEQMQTLELAPTLPDISSSISSIQKHMEEMELQSKP